MQKVIIILSNFFSLLIIIEQFNLWDSLLLFLLVGTVPGTSFSLSPAAMLVCLGVVVSFGTLVLLSQTDTISTPSKKALPKKRYNQI